MCTSLWCMGFLPHLPIFSLTQQCLPSFSFFHWGYVEGRYYFAFCFVFWWPETHPCLQVGCVRFSVTVGDPTLCFHFHLVADSQWILLDCRFFSILSIFLSQNGFSLSWSYMPTVTINDKLQQCSFVHVVWMTHPLQCTALRKCYHLLSFFLCWGTVRQPGANS